MWIRASLAGFTFARHPKPLGWYTCRPDSLSSSDTRMLSGILRVFAKTRPALPAASAERAILDRQVARFEMELLAAEARNSLIARRRARGRRATCGAARAPRRLACWLGAAGAAAVAPALALAAYRLRAGTAPKAPRSSRSAAVDSVAPCVRDPRRALDRSDASASDRPAARAGRRPQPDARRRARADHRRRSSATRASRCSTPSERPACGRRRPRRKPRHRIVTHRAGRVAALGSLPQRRSVDAAGAAALRALRQRLSRRRRQVRSRQPGALADRVSPVRSRAVHQPRSHGPLPLVRAGVARAGRPCRLSRKSIASSTASTTPPRSAPRSDSKPGRPTALYAPTWSPASSLNVAGEDIITTLADAGWNVIVKLHSLSLDLQTPKFSGGVDWRTRMAAIERPGRIVHVEDAGRVAAARGQRPHGHRPQHDRLRVLPARSAADRLRRARADRDRAHQPRARTRAAQRAPASCRTSTSSATRRARRSSGRTRSASSGSGSRRRCFTRPGGATDRAVAAAYDLLALAKEPQWRAAESCDRSASA